MAKIGKLVVALIAGFIVYYLADLFLGWFLANVISIAPSLSDLYTDSYNVTMGILNTIVILVSLGLGIASMALIFGL